MKKILLAFDGSHFSEGAFEFARRINKTQPIYLTGVFLPQVDFSNLWSYAGASSGALFIPLVEKEDADQIKKNIERFETLCLDNRIDFSVHKDFMNFALPELKKETRYADLVILGSESFYKNIGVEEPNEYLKDALHDAECPVVVVPENFLFPEHTIIAFDGSESSAYAVKQFSYLFPEFCSNETIVVHSGESDDALPYELHFDELISNKFNEQTLIKLKSNSKKYFAEWIKERKRSILVTGAFGRSSLSQFFRKSFVSGVIRDHNLPVFIAHR